MQFLITNKKLNKIKTEHWDKGYSKGIQEVREKPTHIYILYKYSNEDGEKSMDRIINLYFSKEAAKVGKQRAALELGYQFKEVNTAPFAIIEKTIKGIY